MASDNEILIDVDKLENLLPRKRILDHKDLHMFHLLLFRLWEQGKNIPEDFRQKIFNVKEYFDHYLASSPGPYRPTKAEALEKLKKTKSVE